MSKNLLLSFKGNKQINTEIRLTGSKSECNRALIISALSKGTVGVENLSVAADTVTLAGSLKSVVQSPKETNGSSLTVDIGPAGTAMRFLTAFLSLQQGNFLLTGTERMKQRPIGILVEALQSIGAKISYAENEGFPPLHIGGPFEQSQANVKIKGDISSQYISALLMIAPALPQGLSLEIEGELTSKPYVEMTLAMLEQTGITHEWNENIISIAPQQFKPAKLYVEPDWSAASYWYSIAALADEAEIFLPGLNGYSLQGDSKITEIMANFGITSQFKNGGVWLKKEPKQVERKIFDMKECPDLAQTVVVICAALGHDATFTGLETLKIKETNRVLALQTELAKIGVKFIEKNFSYKLDCSGLHFPEKISVSTYEDHRMAMAFAPLALKIAEVEIEDQHVVDKSYPYFWEDLAKAGFNIGTA
ncbi:3-phosphoshikimate 1-carboxyvinyltransferase [Pedobacter sp. KR3-3]|uniref:3-phosphoshikimate 1-carboxyvinyltransferase n=1 Tax=Pedobacter albus TaxID=3113905 RepID=A0ABU7I2R2_9SPHI|nr:3-phosphoshikimate 1-carboxyvinyltransferase [Pedobacter sp. KR3-3]MEE1943754.1 3-phosphoshikimate 1-carboxyvinyltransferase [Pedobacter sp. KR3-3]